MTLVRSVDIGSELEKFNVAHAATEAAAKERPSTLLGTATAVQAGFRELTEREATLGRAGLASKCQKGCAKKKSLYMTPKISLWVSQLSSSKV